MDALNITFGLTNLLSGLLFIALGIPLVKRKVPMNHFYGARFPQSFKSREAWYAINEHGGRLLIHWSLFLVALGLIAFIAPFDQTGDWLVFVFAFAPLTVLIPAVQSYLYARRF